MNPIYRFLLFSYTQGRRVFPNYKDDLSLDYSLEQNQEFYRGKLSGELIFQKGDYSFIVNKAFDTQFTINIEISYNGGQSWAPYWSGRFWKTDCKFDDDAQTVTVTPTVNDKYNAVLAGLEKEYNLIELAPVIQPVKLDKRPMIQVYVPGQTVIGCFLSGMWWEQECKSVLETDMVDIGGQLVSALEYKYHFSKNKTARIVEVTQQGTPVIPDVFYGDTYTGAGTTQYVSGEYKFVHSYTVYSGGSVERFVIARTSNEELWYAVIQNQPPRSYPFDVTLNPVSGTAATGSVKLHIHDISVYSRYITDTEQAFDITAYPIPQDDIVSNNRNYNYVIGYYFPETIFFYDALSSTPTQWGIYQPGKYYVEYKNTIFGINESFPVSRSSWGRISIWFAFDAFDWLAEQYWRKEYTLKDAFPLWSVISVLLAQTAPGITHEGTTAYSQFLYGSNPISYINQYLFISPKSNIVSSGYDQPAQKAPITLKAITDMLRDCFRCYWFIDGQNRFRIEHISYFMNGGAYPGTPDFPKIGTDLTKLILTRNGKPWSYARNQYEYDKPDMAARYQFGWMDDVTELFDGYPIDIVSQYVNPDNIEHINVSQFTSDIDYILLNPDAISKDGFALLAAQYSGGQYKLPYVNFGVGGSEKILQNAYVAFAFLQRYYMYDMPAWNARINGDSVSVQGVKKLKTQTIKFPALTDPENMFNLIKTEIGNGTIQKLSINLLSRIANATLKYDTE